MKATLGERKTQSGFWVFTLVIVFIFTSWAPAQGQPIPNQYIVVLNDNVQPDQAIRGLGVAPQHVYRHALKGFSLQIPAQAAAALARNPMVKYIEQDQEMSIVGSDKDITVIQGKPPKPTPTPTLPPAQTTPWGIERIGVNLNVIDPIGIGVAVIDTGVDLDHPDLNVVSGVTIPGIISSVAAGDDDNGHGSHVAGTIGAQNNTLGVVGVAPGAPIYSVKVLDRRGRGSTSTVVAGIDWVTANADKIQVANMSLGGYYSPMLNEAVNRSITAGVIYVVAAGNDSSDASNYSPASVPDAVTVSAVDSNNQLAYFSNWGTVVDMAAPGVNIYSTYKGGGYATMSGTSMAAPHVTGAVALYLFLNPATTDPVTALISAGETYNLGSYNKDGVNEPQVEVSGFYPVSTQ